MENLCARRLAARRAAGNAGPQNLEARRWHSQGVGDDACGVHRERGPSHHRPVELHGHDHQSAIRCGEVRIPCGCGWDPGIAGLVSSIGFPFGPVELQESIAARTGRSFHRCSLSMRCRVPLQVLQARCSASHQTCGTCVRDVTSRCSRLCRAPGKSPCDPCQKARA